MIENLNLDKQELSMSDLENLSPTPENSDEPKKISPGVMLTTMLLLIVGLLLSSILLLYSALKRQGGPDAELNMEALIEQAKAHTAQPRKTEQPAELKPENPSTDLKQIFSGNTGKTTKWPKLKLTGFGSSAQGGFAIINGRQVLLNESIGPVQLVAIRSHGVIVEYMGERKTLTVDLKD